MDIYMADYYPIRGDPEFQSPDFSDYYSTLWNFNQYAKTNIHKPFWPILQAHRLSRPACPNNDPNYPLCGFPTAAEERYMIYAAIQSGAKGLSFFDTANEEMESALEARFASDRLAPLLHQFTKFSNCFVGASAGTVTTDSNIDTSVIAKLYRDLDAGGDNYVLLLVHHGPEEHLSTGVIFQEPAITSNARIFLCLISPMDESQSKWLLTRLSSLSSALNLYGPRQSASDGPVARIPCGARFACGQLRLLQRIQERLCLRPEVHLVACKCKLLANRCLPGML
jgi:hypothetical protein